MTMLLVGCGKMGSAMLEGWLDQGTHPSKITIVEPNTDAANDFVARLGVKAVASADELPANYAPDVVVLAVKPQIMDQVVAPYAKLTKHGPVFLSIAAGRTIASFETLLGTDAAIVRAMPNTPASIGRGITVGCPNANVTDTQADLCKNLLKAVGDVEWVTDESLMDAVTALSGSGPAYIFLLAEAMSHAGQQAGLAPDLAARLARATVAGSGELLNQSLLPAATLRENVTSPNGTTAAALDVLMADGGLTDVMTKAILAATKRSIELAKS
ncbi:MAG: pyrroline-5-carboxylate reductase [Rhodospirillaceae bacterium]|nr:MAG: pyrroline-5-carboxylate reductase [Rhodospirillaceae bacterium]